jgi:trans-aconitate methyltransferase
MKEDPTVPNASTLPAGPLPSWDPTGYATHARFVATLGEGVVSLLDPRPGERILDLGCGDGVLTEQLVAAGAKVIGVDASPAMVAAARARGLDARVGDAAALDLAETFDAVFSNAALHWVPDAAAVAVGVHRLLRPGGRFVAVLGGHLCCAAIRAACYAALDRAGLDGAAADPWFFPTPARYRRVLEDAGLVVERLDYFARPTPLPTGIQGWLRTFCDPFFARLPKADRQPALNWVEAQLRPILTDENGDWFADYTRLRVRASRPASR